MTATIGGFRIRDPEGQCLEMDFGSLDEDSGIELAEWLKKNDTLTELSMTENYLGVEVAKALADALLVNKTLQKLDLFLNIFEAEGARALARPLSKNCSLTDLSLEGNSLGDKGAKAVARGLVGNSTLLRLNLSANSHTEPLGDAGAEALAGALLNNRFLRRLDLSKNVIQAQGGRALSFMLKENTTLRRLELQDNELGDKGVKPICEVLKKRNRSLLRLDIGRNNLTVSMGLLMATLLDENPILRQLGMSGNQLGYEGVRPIARSLRERNCTLLVLELSFTELCDKCAHKLSKMLKANGRLQQLDVRENEKLTEQGVKELTQALKRNYSIIQLDTDYISADMYNAIEVFTERNKKLLEENIKAAKDAGAGAGAAAEAKEEKKEKPKEKPKKA
ncbi:MAG: hypothetical protein HYX48_01830 [Chlamydiales bacterium]|nr:hypothetical protein [Chlamydiales bacterium]